MIIKKKIIQTVESSRRRLKEARAAAYSMLSSNPPSNFL